MEKTFTALINTLMVPILFLDIIGGIIGFIWLATLGNWGVILGGVGYMILGVWIVSLILMPSLLLAMPIGYFAERKNRLGVVIFGLLNLIYVAFAIYFCCALVFKTYTSSAAAGTTIMPYLLWCYATATAPWAYMASKEGNDASGTFISLFFCKLGLATVVILTGLLGVSLDASLVIFAFIMGFEVLITFIFLLLVMKEDSLSDVANEVIDVDDYSIDTTNSNDLVNSSNVEIGDDSSILLVGQTGTGKTELVRSLLEKLKSNYSPKEVSFVIFDMKQVEFQDEDKQYLLKDIVTESVEGLKVLKDLVALANKRIRDKVEYPAIVLYIEECDIAAQYQDKFDELLISLIDKSKSANFCIIYSTSRVDSGTISYELLKHFEVLMVSRLSSGSTSYLGIDDTSDISGYNFRKIDNRSITRHTHPTSTDSIDVLVEKAKKLFKKEGRASSALIQRELHVGYPVAVKVMDRLEDMGLIGPADGAKPRRVINDFAKTKKPVHKIGNDELVDWDTIK